PLPDGPTPPIFEPNWDPNREPDSFQSDPDPTPADTIPFTTAKSPTFNLAAPIVPPSPGRFAFAGHSIPVGYETVEATYDPTAPQQADTPNAPSTLKPLGQLRDSFILATNDEGLWIIDQHVAHERILFEKVLRERDTEQVQRQRLLMPLLIDLLPAQMITFATIAEELERNGFEA